MNNSTLDSILEGKEYAFVTFGTTEDQELGFDSYGILIKDSAGDYYIAGVVTRNRMQTTEFDLNFNPKKIENALDNISMVSESTYRCNLNQVQNKRINTNFYPVASQLEDLKVNDIVYINSARPVIGKLQQKMHDGVYLTDTIQLGTQFSEIAKQHPDKYVCDQFFRVPQNMESKYIALKAIIQ